MVSDDRAGRDAPSGWVKEAWREMLGVGRGVEADGWTRAKP